MTKNSNWQEANYNYQIESGSALSVLLSTTIFVITVGNADKRIPLIPGHLCTAYA